MADLPKYQQTGRVYADLPQFDFSNVREAFKASQSLTSALDRVTDFANKSAAKQAEAKAERFSIDNPLTLEQVQEAAKSGITPEDLVAASGGGKIWQDTVKKLQGEQLRTQLEVLGKQALLDLQTQVDTNQITNMNDVRAKQEAIVNGLRKTLNFSPDSVMRFDATMGTVTSSLYKEAQNKLVQDYKINQQSQAMQNVDNSVRAYQSLIKHEDVTDPAMLRDIEYALAEQVYRQSGEGGAEFALKQRDAFVKRMQEEKLNHLTKAAADPSFAKDAGEAIAKIAKGDFKLNDGKDYSAIYANESPENQAKIRAYVRQQFIDLNTTNNEIEKNKVDNLKSEVNSIELDYYKTKNPKLLNRLIEISRQSDGKAISASAIESIKKSADEKEGDLQYTDNIIKMKDEIKRGRYDSLDAMYARGEQLGVSRRSINKFVVPSFLSKADALVDDILDSYADISNPSGSKAAKVRKRIAVQQEVDIAYEAQFNKEGSDTKPKLSKAEIAAKLVDEKIKGNSQKTAKVTTLNSTANKYGLSFTSASSLDELTEQDIDRKVKDPKDNAEIKKQLRELK